MAPCPVTNGRTEIAFPSFATFYGVEGFLALLCDPAAKQLWLRLLLFHSHKAAFLTIPMGFKLLQQVCQLGCVSQGCLGGGGGQAAELLPMLLLKSLGGSDATNVLETGPDTNKKHSMHKPAKLNGWICEELRFRDVSVALIV